MGKIKYEDINCEGLKQAYWRAYEKLIDSRKYPDVGVNWPPGAGSQVSIKGQLSGKDACSGCGRIVSLESHLKPIIGATEQDSGKPIKVFDFTEVTVSATVSGNSCTNQ